MGFETPAMVEALLRHSPDSFQVTVNGVTTWAVPEVEDSRAWADSGAPMILPQTAFRCAFGIVGEPQTGAAVMVDGVTAQITSFRRVERGAEIVIEWA